MKGEPSDADLVAAIARRDLSSLATLYDRYGGIAYTLAHRILGDPQPAQDVVQDGFLAVWRGAGTYVPERGDVRSWLLSIIHHRAIDLVRRRTAFRVAPLESAAERPAEDDTASEAARNLERHTVRQALAELPEAQRRAIELAYFGGYTQTEVAALLGIPLGTVKGRVRIGLQKMRRALEGLR